MPNKPNTSKEEPVRIYIYDFLAEDFGPSHAALTYKGQTIDFGTGGFLESPDRDMHGCKVYEVYPSQIGVDPKKLQQAIVNRKKQLTGKDYQYFTQNCADQVIAVLKDAGAKDLPSVMGIPSLSGKVPEKIKSFMNPALSYILDEQTLEKWVQKHGSLVEVRKCKKDYYQTKSTFCESLKILEDPEKYKNEIRKERDKALSGEINTIAGKSPTELLEEYKNTLSKDEYEKIKKQYAAMLVPQKPTPAEQAKIKAEYTKKLALANTPRQELYEKTLLSLAGAGAGNDKLLYKDLLEQCSLYPEILREFKKDLAKYNASLGNQGLIFSQNDKYQDNTPTKSKSLPNQYLRKATIGNTHTT